MAQVLRQLPLSEDRRFINREEKNSDAGIFQIAEDTALVQSVDFFTPVVDDPNLFGEIAAANALSDIYAVGGTPITALNLISFPCHKLESDILRDILFGGYTKVKEAGAVVVGGHSIEDDEPKYGLAVTGVVDPCKIITTSGARPGEILVLSKPLGTGIITTALKGGVVNEDQAAETINGMAALNNKTAQIMKEIGVSACTDVTGFGLLGHAAEMAESSQVSIKLRQGLLPLYPLVEELAEQGFIPGGTYRNLDFYRPVMEMMVDDEKRLKLMADPQTSGGLLMSVPAARMPKLIEAMVEAGIEGYPVGEVVQYSGRLLFIEE